MTRLYILRHGETEWNRANNRFCGRSDIPLSEEGERQAESAAAWLAGRKIGQVYASPLLRAVQTAEAIARPHGLHVRREPGIAEIDYGVWEGLTQPEIERRYPEEWSEWFLHPEQARAGGTGENAKQVSLRYRASIAELCRRHPEENVAVISHSAATRMFLAAVLQMPSRAYRTLVLHNTGVCVLETTAEGEYKLLQLNGKPDAL